MGIRSPNCVQHILPTSFKVPAMNNAEYYKFFKASLPIYRNFTVTIVNEDREMVVDVEKRTVSMHVRSRADTDIGEYKNEYIMVARMTEDGNLVEEVWEFVDGFFTAKWSRRLQAAGLQAKAKL